MLITIKISSCTKSIVYCASRGYCGISTCIVVRSVRISTSKHRCYTWTIIITNIRIIVDCCWVHTASDIATRTIIKSSYRRIIVCCLISTTIARTYAIYSLSIYCNSTSSFTIIYNRSHRKPTVSNVRIWINYPDIIVTCRIQWIHIFLSKHTDFVRCRSANLRPTYIYRIWTWPINR